MEGDVSFYLGIKAIQSLYREQSVIIAGKLWKLKITLEDDAPLDMVMMMVMT